MSRPIPQPGERYKHYKLKDGKDYIATVIGIARHRPVLDQDGVSEFVLYGDLIKVIYELGKEYSFIVKCTKTEDYYEVIYRENDGWWLWNLGISFDSLTRECVGWARPLDNFMEVLSTPYIGEYKSYYYRFEKID